MKILTAIIENKRILFKLCFMWVYVCKKMFLKRQVGGSSMLAPAHYITA